MTSPIQKAEPAPTGLALLRTPFPEHQISKLPKESRAQSDERKARKAGCMVWKCPECGGPHHKDAVHLDYVGHAAATDRLLDADSHWNWEPVADPASLGLPTVPGGMWIKLTVDGVSRYGFGSADGKTGGDAVKEVIGDAIRNAGMRFGMALDLWHKGDLHLDEPSEESPANKAPSVITDTQRDELILLLDHLNVPVAELLKAGEIKALSDIAPENFDAAKQWVNKRALKLREAKAPKGEFAGVSESDLPY